MSAKEIEILGWTPVYVDIRHPIHVQEKWKNGLVLVYPLKLYSVPAALRYVVHPELIEDGSIKKTVAIVRISVYSGVKLTKCGVVRDVLNITMLPPKRANTKPKYHLIVSTFKGKDTGVGSYRKVRIVRGEEYIIWKTSNSSSSGNHWIDYIVALLPPDADILLREDYRSGRGNIDENLVSLKTGKTVERFEVLSVEPINSWVRKLRMRDNLTGEEFTAVELEWHYARKTSAMTEHEWEPEDALVALYGTRASGKTHWTEIYRVTKTVRVITVRVSNRGNKHEYETVITP